MMLELIGLTLLAAGLAFFGARVVTEIGLWRDRRNQARIKRIERELAQAQKRLAVLALQHAAGLQALAHEARKALIMESFRAAQEQAESADDRRY